MQIQQPPKTDSILDVWLERLIQDINPINTFYPSANVADQGVVTASKNSIKDYVDAIGTSLEATLILEHNSKGNTTTYTLTTSETIPSNITLDIEDGAILDGTGTLTQNGPFPHDLSQCFGSSITVNFGSGAVKEVYPEWWGTGNDNIIKAYASITTGKMILPNGTYTTTQTLTIKSGADVIGESQTGVSIEPNAETFAAITISTASTYGFSLKNFTINYGTATGDIASTAKTALGISITNMASPYAYQFVIEDILIKCPYRGVQDASRAWHYTLRHIRVTNAGDYGFHIYHATAKAMVLLDNCAVGTIGAIVAKGGFYLYNINGLTMIHCSVNNMDATANLPYNIIGSKGSMVSCDSENNVLATAGMAIYTLNASFLFVSFPFSSGDHLDATGGSGYMYRVYGSSHVTLASPYNYGTVADSAGIYAVLRVDTDSYCTLQTEEFTAITGAGTKYIYWTEDSRVTRQRKLGLYCNDTTVTVGTGEDDLENTIISANTIGYNGVIHVLAAGYKTGANDTKTIKLYVGATNITVHPAVNNEYHWKIEAWIFNLTTTNQRITWVMTDGDGVTAANTLVLSGHTATIIDTKANVTIKLTGECANASDVITQTMWLVERL